MNGGETQPKPLFQGPTEPQAYASTERQPENAVKSDIPEVRWAAAEFVDHQKGLGWIAALIGIGTAASVGVYFLTGGDWFASIVTLMLAGLFGAAALRRPRTLEYSLDGAGVTIDKKFTPYEEFRSFSVMHEGNVESVVLDPTKRWAPPLSLYYSAEQSRQITDMLGEFLPYEPREAGYVDRFLHKIRF